MGLLGLFLVITSPASVMAADKPAVNLEQAIRIVKNYFEIPQVYRHFTSGYNSYNNRQAWSLNWEATQPPGGSFHAEVDAVTGEVLNINNWKPVDRPVSGPRLPALSESQARQVAEKLLARLIPGRLSGLKFVAEESQVIPLMTYEPYIYNFRWQRMINGVPFTGDNVIVGINGENGQLVNYYYEWTRSNFPDLAGVVPLAKAREVFDKSGMLQLQYILINSGVAGQLPAVKLIYKLSHPSNGIIDALYGEPLKLDYGQWLMGAGGDGGAMEMKQARSANAKDGENSLSPEEQKEVEKTANTLSQDEAIAAVKKWLDLPADLKLREANLSRYWPSPEIPVWYLGWDATSSTETRYMNARVNAITGELIGFDLAPVSREKIADLSREEAQKIAVDFLQKINSQRFAETKLNDQNENERILMLKEGRKPSAYYFNYQRLVNAILFPNNGISVTIDAASKTITNYDLNWSNIKFPVPEGRLTDKQAVEIFLRSRPLTLTYTRLSGPEGPGEIRLVYQPQAFSNYTPSFSYIDAKAGELLDWELKTYAVKAKVNRFKDVKGNFAEKEISLLGQAGLFGEYDDQFRPNEKVSTIHLLRTMLAAQNSPGEIRDLKNQEIIKRVTTLGWINEDLRISAPLTRENLAKIMIRFLNLDRAARAEGIFRVPYTDAQELTPGAIGYVALARGLGIMQGEDNKFAPKQTVSRAEAALVLIRTLRVKP